VGPSWRRRRTQLGVRPEPSSTCSFEMRGGWSFVRGPWGRSRTGVPERQARGPAGARDVTTPSYFITSSRAAPRGSSATIDGAIDAPSDPRQVRLSFPASAIGSLPHCRSRSISFRRDPSTTDRGTASRPRPRRALLRPRPQRSPSCALRSSPPSRRSTRDRCSEDPRSSPAPRASVASCCSSSTPRKHRPAGSDPRCRTRTLREASGTDRGSSRGPGAARGCEQPRAARPATRASPSPAQAPSRS
jgi:hypothetical protein